MNLSTTKVMKLFDRVLYNYIKAKWRNAFSPFWKYGAVIYAVESRHMMVVLTSWNGIKAELPYIWLPDEQIAVDNENTEKATFTYFAANQLPSCAMRCLMNYR